MKKSKLNPTSTNIDFKQYLFACKYSPDDTTFHKQSTVRSSSQSSTPDPCINNLEIIRDLPHYNLQSCIECSVSRDEDGSFLVECPSFNLYSSGNSRHEAVENMKENIVSLYEDLMENDDFSDDWLKIKQTLINTIVSNV